MNRKEFLIATAGLGIMSATKPLQALSDSLPEDGQLMPVLFVGHGNPMNAIEENEYSLYWQKLGKEIPTPKAVLCVSAHWLTRGTHITAMEAPKTIHDFGGFPQELFDVQYPAPGDETLAKETKELIKSTEIGLDNDWGLDHGCWSVIKQMYPEAKIPVLQLSVDFYKEGQYHYDLGKELFELRKKGILIVGSGNMVHNLSKAGFGLDPYDWCIEMNEVFKKHILEGNHAALIDYQKLDKAAKLAIPTPDHYFPLLYTLALQQKGEDLQLFNDKCLAGSLSMTSLKIG